MNACSKSKQSIRGSMTVNILGLVVAFISCVAAVLVVPEIRKLFSLETKPSVEKVVERVVEKPVFKLMDRKENSQIPPPLFYDEEEFPDRYYSSQQRKKQTFSRARLNRDYSPSYYGDSSVDIERLKAKRQEQFDALREIVDRYNQTAKDVIKGMGR